MPTAQPISTLHRLSIPSLSLFFPPAPFFAPQERQSCSDTSTIYSWFNFIGGITIIPLLIIIFTVYYRVLRRYHARLDRAEGTLRRHHMYLLDQRQQQQSAAGRGGAGAGL